MIIALLFLALAMIVGGSIVAFLGWDIVLVERGWTMVIAGSVVVTGGAILLGLAAAVSRLGKIHNALSRLREQLDQKAPVVQQAPADLSLATLSGALAGGMAVSQVDVKEPEKDSEMPDLFVDREQEAATAEVEDPGRVEVERAGAPILPFPSRPQPEPARDDEGMELKVPDFLLAGRAEDSSVEARTSEADASVFEAPPETVEAEKDHEEDVTPAAWPEPSMESDEADVSPEETPAEEPRRAMVIGTYNSGDNKYVMFSDGSIEAQTPKGIFHFKSLDELKEFIAAGGESNSSAAI